MKTSSSKQGILMVNMEMEAAEQTLTIQKHVVFVQTPIIGTIANNFTKRNEIYVYSNKRTFDLFNVMQRTLVIRRGADGGFLT